ncbi:glycosyltransferase family 4 protein [Sphingobacterium sp.]|uniref:glycosyltransferase family 4 protein n=1 Tax=Sphingobacterium sp. TaxID=341027 RepID=UPI0025864B92|nr:glycosyltransferase family 4 protein [Sphingobacterium sp.]WET70808.1 MAG: glycosyltransferase family 4 protein [Sphingobacterium sp.]
MRILIVSQYFWPENFRINDIALGLQERGHEIIVLTAYPNYPQGKFYNGYEGKPKVEIWNDIKIYRSKLISRGSGRGIRLFLNYISFALSGMLTSFRIKEDIDSILVFEPSPITVGIPAITAKFLKKAPISFWVQDLWPASLSAAGGVKNKFVLGIFDSLTRFIYKQSRFVLIQSRMFEQYIVDQGINRDKIKYLPNTTEDFYFPKSSAKYNDLLPQGFKIFFAGNLGEAQSLDTFVAAAKEVLDMGIAVHWIIIGDGRYKYTLEQSVKKLGLDNYVHFMGKYPPTEMADFFSYADALYVSLKKDYIFSLTIPSKIQSYLACGKPILASLDGEGARIIQEANAGFTSPAENSTELSQNIFKLFGLSNEEREQLGRNGLVYFEREFKREIVLDKIEVTLKIDSNK